MKQKLTTVIIIAATLILAGIAVFTAIRLYELRQQPVAPNVPESMPEAVFSTGTVSVSCTDPVDNDTFTMKLRAVSNSPTLCGGPGEQLNCPTAPINVGTYSTDYTISVEGANPGKTYTAKAFRASFFCEQKCGNQTGGACNLNPQGSDGQLGDEVTANLTSDNSTFSFTITRPGRTGDPCGSFQTDSWFTSIGNCPAFTTPGLETGDIVWSACLTGRDCPADQPSPTPTLTNTCSLSFSLTVPLTACNGTCTANSDCQTGLTCSSGKCRNPSCTSETDCICPTPTPTPASCNNSCTTNAGCESGLVCSSGSCRNPSCTTETDCSCPTATPTATPTTTATPTSRPTPTATPEPQLPEAGSTTPTIVGLGLGLILLVVSMVLAI